MLIHLISYSTYSALALAVVLLGGETGLVDKPLLGHMAIGGFVFFAGIHLLAVIAARHRRYERALVAMHALNTETRRELQGARDEAKAIHEAITQAAQAREGQTATIGEVMAEMKVLQTLVNELSERSVAPPPEPPRAMREPPPLADAAGRSDRGSRSLRGLGEGEVLEIVRQGLREGRVDLFVQPIVSLPQRKHRFYECFSRIRAADGGMIGPDQYLAGAEREGLIGAIDNMLLFRCVQLVRRVQKASREVGIIVNISEHSLADKRFFRDFTAFVAENRELAPQLIFEFAQAHVARHGAAVMLELERLARLGFRFSMDQVTDLDLDVDALGARHFRFIKIDAQRLLHASREAEPRLDLRRFKSALDRNQIDLIVERIESEQILVELLDHPLDFGQGYLFGEPRVAKAA